jgi:hypothetical protein
MEYRKIFIDGELKNIRVLKSKKCDCKPRYKILRITKKVKNE